MSGSSHDSSSQRDSNTDYNDSSINLNNSTQNQTIEKRFNKILIEADNLISQENFSQAVMKLNLLTEKINFLKQNHQIYDKKLELVCLYNLASAYHKQWILDQCIILVEKFIIMLKSLIRQQQTLNKSKYSYKMKHILIKAQLQYCAILSQVGDHYKALAIAIEVSQSLKGYFTKGYSQINTFLQKVQKSNSKNSIYSSVSSMTEQNSSKMMSNDKIQFSINVLTKAKQVLKQLINIQTYNQVVNQNYKLICQQLIELKSKTYFWKDNPQNNIKLLRKQLNNSKQQTKNMKYSNQSQNSNINSQNSERNLLGIKKSKNWIQQFTIAKVMVMNPLNYLEFIQKDNLVYQFNHKNLIQKIIYVSVTYFSLAIQIRFIQQTQKKKKQNVINGKQQYKEKNKQSYINKDKSEETQKIKKSQVFHLKSIILLCKMIKQNSAFLNHLVSNYHKHYKQELITIQQECSIAEYSLIYDKRSKSNSIFHRNNEKLYILEQEDNKINYQNKFIPQQSAYFQQSQIIKSLKNKQQFLQKNPIYAFKKRAEQKKKIQVSIQDQNSSKKYISSFRKDGSKQSRSSRYQKNYSKKHSFKDKTIKKISVGKMITLGSPMKKALESSRQKDKSKSPDKSISIGKYGKLKFLKNQQKQSFSLKNLNSFSIGKNSMNSTTLRNNKKKNGQKSPQKSKISQLKQSYEFKTKDFKKKEKANHQSQRVIKQKKDKKKEKLNQGLMLLKKSTSNQNIKKVSIHTLQQEYTSTKQKSKKNISKK